MRRQPAAPNPCVYIVDDDEAVRDSLSVLLESKGYVVKGFASAPEFLAAAPSLPVGCLIVDIRMPEMDGLELQERLRSRALGFPMIVITGHADVPLAVRAMKAGAVDFIEKPFTSEMILGGHWLASPNERDPKSRGYRKACAIITARAGRAGGKPSRDCAFGAPSGRSSTGRSAQHGDAAEFPKAVGRMQRASQYIRRIARSGIASTPAPGALRRFL